jgi:1-phosphofructokinase family hexose kinase
MILCITPNVAADRTLVVPKFQLAGVHRAQSQMVMAGGKGLNVARGIKILGGEALCAGFLGGHTGRLVRDLAETEGLTCAWTWIDGETRTCVLIVDAATHEVTETDEQGPTVNTHDWVRLSQDLAQYGSDLDAVCISGSLPPGSLPESLTAILSDLHHYTDQFWIDMSGPSLNVALNFGTLNIKINHLEAQLFLELKIVEPEDAIRAGKLLLQRGARQAVITMGKSGAVFVSEEASWYVASPTVHAVSTVGSGDVFLAGLVTAFVEGQSAPCALCQAVAAGAANTLTIGGGIFDLHEFKRLLAATQLLSIEI